MADPYFNEEDQAPDFNLPTYTNLLSTVLSPSPGKPPDDAQEFGMPSGYSNQALKLSGQEAVARENAMNMLRQALSAQTTDISPTQGIASALLAAIPTLGGYMLGKAVGAPKIPEGTYFKGISPGEFNKEFAGGADAGGLAGSQIGGDAAAGYIKQIKDYGTAQVPILEKMSALEQQRAQQLGTQGEAVTQAGLGQAEADRRQKEGFTHDEAMIPLEVQKAIDIAKGTEQYKAGTESATPLDETTKALWAEKLHIDPALLNTKGDVAKALQASKLQGVQGRFDKTFDNKLSQQDTGPASKPMLDANGNPSVMSTDEQKNVVALDKTVPTILRNVEVLKNSIAKDGTLTLGDPGSLQAQALAQIVNRLRGFDNQGIRFNEFLKDVDQTQIGIAVLSDNPVGALANVLKGQDALKSLERFGREVATQYKEGLIANKRIPDPDGLAQYDPDAASILKRYLSPAGDGDAAKRQRLAELRAKKNAGEL